MNMVLQRAGSLLLEFTTTPLREDHGVPLAIMGVIVVFIALSLVASLIKVLPLVLGRPEPAAQRESLPHDLQGDEISEETLAVIAAAVADTLQRPHRIVRIRGATPGEHDWSLEGRLQHHQSHRIPRADHR